MRPHHAYPPINQSDAKMKSRPVILVATLLLACLGGCDSYGPDDDDENDPDNPYVVDARIRTGAGTYVFVQDSTAAVPYKSTARLSNEFQGARK